MVGMMPTSSLRSPCQKRWPELVWGFRCQAVFVVCVPDFVGGSIAPVATRWHDCSECVEVKIDNGLKGLSGGTPVQAVGQCVVPGGILGLQRDQSGDRVIPALSFAPSVRRPTVADLRRSPTIIASGRDPGRDGVV